MGDAKKIKFIINTKTGCWEWARHIGRGGYGLMRDQGRTRAAHRVYYEKKFGSIPSGKHIDHLCRVRCCVNPDHLEAVSPKENIRRGLGSKLTKQQVEAIRQSLGSAPLGWQRRCAIAFGVSEQTICDIKHGRIWCEV